MRRRATPVRTPPGRVVLDTCGTGGDGAGTFNISTAAALRRRRRGRHAWPSTATARVSSRSGSADVLAALRRAGGRAGGGRASGASPRCGSASSSRRRCTRPCGTWPPIRREVGVRTRLQPARAPGQPGAGAAASCWGSTTPSLVPVVAETLARLGTERALVVHGLEGLDEISPSGPTRAAWVEAGQVREVVLRARGRRAGAGPGRRDPGGDAGGQRRGSSRDVLDGHDGPAAATRCCSTPAAALWVAGAVQTLREGVLRAAESIDSRGGAHPAGAPGGADPGGRDGVSSGVATARLAAAPRRAGRAGGRRPRGLRAAHASAPAAPRRGGQPAPPRAALRGRAPRRPWLPARSAR